MAVGAMARVLTDRPSCRLVLFEAADRGYRLIDIEEFPALAEHANRIEWRLMVPVERLAEELARFDINLAPLEVGNPFCEAKSELKYFEAALVDVADGCVTHWPICPVHSRRRNRITGLLGGGLVSSADLAD